MPSSGSSVNRGSVRDAILQLPLGRQQIMVIAICGGLLLIEGFDVLALSFSASAITREWGMRAQSLGLLFSAGLVGIGIGTLTLGPVADLYGRRPIIIVSTALVSVGMLGSAMADSLPVFIVARMVTGLGVGGLASSSGALIFEYAPLKYREFGIGVNSIGFPLGAIVGGSVAYALIETWGWRAVFLFGGIISTAFLPIIIWKLPESVDYLIERRPRRALDRLNQILAWLKITPIDVLPMKANTRQNEPGSGKIAALQQGWPVYAGYFLFMSLFYFLLSWLPKLLVDAGQSEHLGNIALTAVNAGGIVGVLTIGAFTPWFGVKRLTVALLVVTGAGMVLLGMAASNATAIIVLAVPLGIAAYASIVGLFSIAAAAFPAAVRVTGISIALTFGKIGSILAPYVAGRMLDAGLATNYICGVFAIPVLLAALILVSTKIGAQPPAKSALPA